MSDIQPTVAHVWDQADKGQPGEPVVLVHGSGDAGHYILDTGERVNRELEAFFSHRKDSDDV